MDCRVPILMYHSIADDGPPELARYRVSPGAFRRQMVFLRDHGYHSISLTEWAFSIATNRFIPGCPVIITFDDGYADFAGNAWPVLAETGLRATLFVVTGRVGGVADWNRIAQHRMALLNWDQLRMLQQQGMAIASHCAAHRILTELSDREIAADCTAARDALRRELGAEVTCVSYPWGISDARVRRICAEGGYRSGVGVEPAASGLGDDLMNLPRLEIFGDDDIDAFARKLTGADDSAEPVAQSPEAGISVVPAAPFAGLEGDVLSVLSARLQRVVDELVVIKHELAKLRTPSTSLHGKLLRLFSQPLTDPAGDLLTPHQEISPGIRVSFEPAARVRLTVLPKHDHTVSPEACLNLVRLAYSGLSRWFGLDIALAWPELENAARHQLGISVQASRKATCRAVLRFWQKDNQYIEMPLAEFELEPAERNYNFSGELTLPDPLALDHNSEPLFLLLFDTDAPLELDLAYLNLYFA